MLEQTIQTSAIILAAGFSSRMGQMKALLRLNHRTVLEQAILLFQNAGVNDILVVTGHGCKALSPVIQASGARQVHNAEYRSGMFSSVLAGVRNVAQHSRAVFLLPVDIPLIRPWSIRELRRVFTQHPEAVIHPGFNGKRGHPPLIPSGLIPDILSWNQPGGLAGFLALHDSTSITVDLPDRHILMDMDTPEDYRLLKAANQRRDIPTAAECDHLLNHRFPVSQDIIQHSRTVANVAVAIGNALNAAGGHIHLETLYAAAMLHDIAKGHRDHARLGGRWLSDMGFEYIGAIVAAHTDPEPEPEAVLTEKTVVFLSDKLVQKDKIVSISQRFETALKRYRDNARAQRNIDLRRKTALAAIQRIELQTGRSLDTILGALQSDNRMGNRQ